MALQLACEAFIDPDEVFCDCELGRYDMIDVVESATDFLVRLSNGAFTGRCEQTVRPVFAGEWDCYVDYNAGDPFKIPLVGPNPTVSQVKIDGDVLATSEYRVLDGQYLMRVHIDTKPLAWPLTNPLWKPSTEDGTFEITYTWGLEVDMVVKRAALEVSCDILDGLSKQKAQFRNATSAELDGLTISQDPLQAEKAGFSWVAQFMRRYPGRARAEVFSPDLNLGWTLHTLS